MTNLQIETWKEIPNSKNYAISNLGNVKRLSHQKWCSVNNSFSTIKEKLLLPNTNNTKGYCRIPIYYTNNTKIVESVHRLVAIAFVENDNPLIKNQVNHKDGIKTNNIYTNLEWCTPSENMLHAYTTGLKSSKTGENSHLSKMKESDIIEIANLLNKGITRKEIKEKFNFTTGDIAELIAGRSWKHLNLTFNNNVYLKRDLNSLTKEQIDFINLHYNKNAQYWANLYKVSVSQIKEKRRSSRLIKI